MLIFYQILLFIILHRVSVTISHEIIVQIYITRKLKKKINFHYQYTISILGGKFNNEIIAPLHPQVIPRTISLDSMTRNRPKPPSHRRPPSRFRTPSPSPTHIVRTESPVGQAMDSHSGVRRIGGITNTVKEDGEHGVNVDDTQPIKNQWVSG